MCQFFLSDVSLEQVSSIKDLGIILSSSLSFENQVYSVVAKANRMFVTT